MTAPIGGAVEAAAIAAKFQAALIKLGVAAVIQALALWRRVPNTGAKDDDWLNASVRLVMSRRRQTRDLAIAYYRLNRALRTGRTIPDPHSPTPATVRLSSLRSEFERLVQQAEQGSEVVSNERTPPAPSPGTPDRHIPVDKLPGLTDQGDEDEGPIEDDAEQEARVVLEALGTSALDKALEGIATERPATEVDAARNDAHGKAGSRQAAAVERLVLNGARSTQWSLADRDGAVLAWARVSTTGTPCGFCAMLISRGAVYKSDKTAQYSDGDLYHNNCHCIAVPIYSAKEFQESRFDLNREYGRLWPEVTRGLSGKAALSAWRRFIRQQQKDTPGPAQAAA